MIARRRRRGVMLIECLVLISVLAVVLGVAGLTVRLLLKLDRAGRAAADQAADILRLGDDFRADAHAAAPAPGVVEGRLTLTLGEGKTVEYASEPARFVRTVREGGKVRRVEAYRRPGRSTLRFEIDPPGPRPFATLIVDRDPSTAPDPLYRDCRVEAELGKDRRHAPRPGS